MQIAWRILNCKSVLKIKHSFLKVINNCFFFIEIRYNHIYFQAVNKSEICKYFGFKQIYSFWDKKKISHHHKTKMKTLNKDLQWLLKYNVDSVSRTWEKILFPKTVKPVYKGHSQEPENVSFMSSCPLYTG